MGGIGHLTADILAEARKEAKAITDAAEAEKKSFLKEEQKRVSETLSSSEKEADAFVAAQQRERIAWAKLEAKKISGEARESIIKDAMDSVYGKLSNFRKEKEYPKFLNERVKSGLQELAVQKPVVHVCKGDKKLLKGVSAVVSEGLPGMGGAIVESQDGSVRVDCTLETLFEEKKELLRKTLYAKLFR